VNSGLSVVMGSEEISALKKAIRHTVRSKRNSLSSEQLLDADQQLAQQYSHYFTNASNLNVALYLQHDGEVGTRHLINLLLTNQCDIYIPKIYADGRNLFTFIRYHADSKLTKNRFGIAEPISDTAIDINLLDIIFLPLTAFDGQGNRIGMGGGFYDRTLSTVQNINAKLIGLAYDFQEVLSCPIDDFDKPLDGMITPTRVIDFSQAPRSAN